MSVTVDSSHRRRSRSSSRLSAAYPPHTAVAASAASAPPSPAAADSTAAAAAATSASPIRATKSTIIRASLAAARRTHQWPPTRDLITPFDGSDSEDFCIVCRENGRDEHGELLLCDGICGRSFHIPCAGLSSNPPIPNWWCSSCYAGLLPAPPTRVVECSDEEKLEPEPEWTKTRTIIMTACNVHEKVGRHQWIQHLCTLEHVRESIRTNQQDKLGYTVLHHAAVQEVPPFLLLKFIELGADVNIKDNDSTLAVHHAFSRQNYPAVLAFLTSTTLDLKAGAPKVPVVFAVCSTRTGLGPGPNSSQGKKGHLRFQLFFAFAIRFTIQQEYLRHKVFNTTSQDSSSTSVAGLKRERQERRDAGDVLELTDDEMDISVLLEDERRALLTYLESRLATLSVPILQFVVCLLRGNRQHALQFVSKAFSCYVDPTTFRPVPIMSLPSKKPIHTNASFLAEEIRDKIVKECIAAADPSHSPAPLTCVNNSMAEWRNDWLSVFDSCAEWSHLDDPSRPSAPSTPSASPPAPASEKKPTPRKTATKRKEPTKSTTPIQPTPLPATARRRAASRSYAGYVDTSSSSDEESDPSPKSKRQRTHTPPPVSIVLDSDSNSEADFTGGAPLSPMEEPNSQGWQRVNTEPTQPAQADRHASHIEPAADNPLARLQVIPIRSPSAAASVFSSPLPLRSSPIPALSPMVGSPLRPSGPRADEGLAARASDAEPTPTIQSDINSTHAQKAVAAQQHSRPDVKEQVPTGAYAHLIELSEYLLEEATRVKARAVTLSEATSTCQKEIRKDRMQCAIGQLRHALDKCQQSLNQTE